MRCCILQILFILPKVFARKGGKRARPPTGDASLKIAAEAPEKNALCATLSLWQNFD